MALQISHDVWMDVPPIEEVDVIYGWKHLLLRILRGEASSKGGRWTVMTIVRAQVAGINATTGTTAWTAWAATRTMMRTRARKTMIGGRHLRYPADYGRLVRYSADGDPRPYRLY